jgi:hypothetical protein
MEFCSVKFNRPITDPSHQERGPFPIDLDRMRFAEPNAAMTRTNFVNQSNLVNVEIPCSALIGGALQ